MNNTITLETVTTEPHNDSRNSVLSTQPPLLMAKVSAGKPESYEESKSHNQHFEDF